MKQEPTRILLVMGREAQEQIMHALPEPHYRFCLADNCEDFRTLYQIEANHAQQADLAIAALTLADGNWRSVYREMTLWSAPAELLVALPHDAGDSLALREFGVSTVLRPPYDSAESRRTILEALEKRQADRRNPSAAAEGDANDDKNSPLRRLGATPAGERADLLRT